MHQVVASHRGFDVLGTLDPVTGQVGAPFSVEGLLGIAGASMAEVIAAIDTYLDRESSRSSLCDDDGLSP